MGLTADAATILLTTARIGALFYLNYQINFSKVGDEGRESFVPRHPDLQCGNGSQDRLPPRCAPAALLNS